MNRPLRLRRKEREEGKYCGRRVNAAHNALHPFRVTRAMDNTHILGSAHKTQSFRHQLRLSVPTACLKGRVLSLSSYTLLKEKRISLCALSLPR